MEKHTDKRMDDGTDKRTDKRMDERIDVEIDVRGLNCPLPILRTKKALFAMATGQLVRVLATDPGSVQDFAAFAKHTGNTVVRQSEGDGVYEYVLRRK